MIWLVVLGILALTLLGVRHAAREFARRRRAEGAWGADGPTHPTVALDSAVPLQDVFRPPRRHWRKREPGSGGGAPVAGGRLLRGRRWLRRLVVAAGALWVAAAAEDVVRAREAAAWPTTPGRVIRADLRDEVVGTRVGKWSNSTQTRTRLHVTYEYAAGGQQRWGWRLDPVLNPEERDFAADRARYAVGRAVTVHYAPDDPSRAVLEAAVPARRVVELIVGLAVAAAGLLWAPRQPRRARPPSAGAQAA